MKKLLLLPLMAGMSLPTMALPPMGDPGFNGVVNFGFSGGEIESNFLAEIDGFGVDLGEERIDSYNSPDSESLSMAMAQIDIGWTFSGGKTRVALGNDFTDVLEFDRTSRLSLRHDFDTLGQMRADVLQPTGFATQVWRDPYLLDEKRKKTDQEVSGARFVWDQIFGSGLGVELLAKNRDIDQEDSGRSVSDLTSEQRKLLDRNGDILSFEVGYRFELNDRHTLRPSFAYVDRDLDGDAMAQDGAVITLKHIYLTDHMQVASQVVYSDLSGDKENPLFDDINDAEGWGLGTVFSFPGSIGFLGKWTPNVQLTWADADSDIDFNDSNIWMIGAGLMRRF